MIEQVWQLLTWPLRAGADRVIASLEAARDEILATWAEWDAQVSA